MGARPLCVGFVLAEQFTLSAFSLLVDTLRLAADDSDHSRPIRCRWSVMASTSDPVRASCGVPVARTSPFVDPAQLDYIVVVGGLLRAGAEQVDAATIAYLQAAARAGTTLVGVCTGSFVLCRAGLMRDRAVCVNWLHYQDFADAFPGHRVVADRLFLVDGDRITCAGGRGAADLAGWIVERHLGRATAQKSRQVLLFDQAAAGPQPQPHPPMRQEAVSREITDPRVRRALLLMEQNLADPLPIAAIAARIGLSTRQLERVFHAALAARPGSLYRTLRLRYARFLLDTTDRSVTDIALEAGFSDGAHFSRQFKATHGVTPTLNRGGEVAGARDAHLAGHRVFD